jgi:hypothetical protein
MQIARKPTGEHTRLVAESWFQLLLTTPRWTLPSQSCVLLELKFTSWLQKNTRVSAFCCGVVTGSGCTGEGRERIIRMMMKACESEK